MTFLETLDQLLQSRLERPKDGSYTSSLFEQGVDRIARKVGEESAELIIAAKNSDKHEICNEAADLLYHVMVLCREQGVSFSEVVAILEKRHT
mgnify:CR=1 FL=1